MAAKDDNRPTWQTVAICLATIVALAYIDSRAPDFEVPIIVYGIIAGSMFGVGNVKKLWGNDDDK